MCTQWTITKQHSTALYLIPASRDSTWLLHTRAPSFSKEPTCLHFSNFLLAGASEPQLCSPNLIAFFTSKPQIHPYFFHLGMFFSSLCVLRVFDAELAHFSWRMIYTFTLSHFNFELLKFSAELLLMFLFSLMHSNVIQVHLMLFTVVCFDDYLLLFLFSFFCF